MCPIPHVTRVFAGPPLHHKSEDSEEDCEGVGCHLEQGHTCLEVPSESEDLD